MHGCPDRFPGSIVIRSSIIDSMHRMIPLPASTGKTSVSTYSEKKAAGKNNITLHPDKLD